jgi:lipopolysaccharide export system protein LptA
MARWQRRAQLGFGLFAAAFAVVLWFMIGERRDPPPAPPVQRLDPEAVSEIKGGDVIQVKGAKRDIRIEFATQVLYADGSAKYTGFKAHVDDRGGRSFEIVGAEGKVAAEQSALDVHGNVNVRTSDGLIVRTEQATFAEADGLLRGDGPITFERERTKGSGVGFRYDRSIDRLELLNQAVVDVAPGGQGGGMAVRAGSAAYSRAERFIRLERGMRMDRDGQTIEAANGTVFLQPDRDEPKIVELRGNATITGAAGASALKQMQARDINLTYADDGRTLQNALLVGQGLIQMSSSAGAAQELRGDSLDVTLAADGAVTQLLGRDNVRATIPPTANAAAREVTAQTLTASGRGGQTLNQMLFETNVVYREDVPGTDPRLVRSRTLNATLADAGTIDQANFSGGFVYEQGRTKAESAEAAYDVKNGTLALRGPDSAKPPAIRNDRVDLRNAATIDVTLSPLKLQASGKVQAVFAAGPQEGERGTTLFNEADAIIVVCDKLTFDEASGAGSYAGKPARVFQENGNQIRGDLITMNEKAGTLASTGNVATSLPLAATAGEGAKGNSTGRAGHFEFDDAKRRAVFAKAAQLDGSQGNLRAERIELTLAGKSNDLQQLTADGSVEVFVEDRKASGDALVYHPSDERYVLNGTPVRLVRGCQESSGRTLTFYRGSERVLVDGSESRVQTKGGKCPEGAALQHVHPEN